MPTKELSQVVPTLLDKIHSFSTARELYNYCISPEFKQVIPTLTPDEVTMLRDDYTASMEMLRGKIKLDQLQNEVLTVSSVRYVDTKFGQAIVLKGEREDGVNFETLTSSSPIQRFFNNINVVKSFPVQVIFRKEPYKLDTGEEVTRWSVNRVNPQTGNSELPW